MAITQSQNLGTAYAGSIVKSFLIWTFTLTICLFVVGFPVIVLMVAIGSLLAVVLQSVMSVSAALLVAGSLLTFNLAGILVIAAALTLKGIHPNEVSWLYWLHGKEDALVKPIYAACPLTCEVKY